MKLKRSFFSLALSFSLVFVSFLSISIQKVNAQDTRIALQRGYRTGYSDGYMAGYRDTIENAARGYDRHREYNSADRAYSKDYGKMEDYKDGYQQGFEIGYDTGFEKRSFDAALPTEIKRRGAGSARTTVETTPAVVTNETPAVVQPVTNEVRVVSQPQQSQPQYQPPPQQQQQQPQYQPPPQQQQQTAATETQRTEPVSYVQNGDQIIVIPIDTELIVEVLGDINTDRNKEGDRFQARVVSPNELGGAIIEGRISRIQKPGRIKRRAEMTLSFDQIRLSDTRWANYNAVLTEVLPVKGDNIRRVDAEGVVEGKSSVKDDTIKVGAATGTGLVVGAIAGGPVGAAVGAGVGAAFGVGAVVVDRGKHVNIIKGQQLRLRTAYETQIR